MFNEVINLLICAIYSVFLVLNGYYVVQYGSLPNLAAMAFITPFFIKSIIDLKNT